MNVEQVAFASENAKDTVETVRAMQSASKELKTTFKAKEFDLEKIDALNDDMADLLDLGEEIQETLGRSWQRRTGWTRTICSTSSTRWSWTCWKRRRNSRMGCRVTCKTRPFRKRRKKSPSCCPRRAPSPLETAGQETAPAVRDTA